MTSSALVIRLRAPRDDEQIVAMRNATDPDLPPTTVGALRDDLDRQPAGVRQEMWIAEEGEGLAGSVSLRQGPWLEDAGLHEGETRVHPSLWGRGIGSRLYDHLLLRANEAGATRILGVVRGERAMRFVMTRGFRRTGREMLASRLDVAEADLSGYGDVERRIRANGIEIRTLARVGDTPQLRRLLYELDMETTEDIPDARQPIRIPYEIWEREAFERSGVFPQMIWIAFDGESPVGVHYLGLREGDAASNDYLGVARAYRGRGIARALKRRTIEWARDHGITAIYTGNLARNIRMLEINTRLGYKQLEPRIEVVKEL